MPEQEQTPNINIIRTENVEPILRRFPAVPQLIVLFSLLTILLGSAVFSFFNSDGDNGEAWVAVELESADKPTAQLTTNTIKPLEEIEIEAKAGFVYDVANKRVLYQKSAEQTLPIASITKLMTTLLAHEIFKDEASISIPQTATLIDSASGLKDGEILTGKALMQYALIASSNDAAYSLASAGAELISTDASEAVFIEAMNLRAKELGLNTLTFNNATGLDVDQSKAGAYGSAKDVTLLMEYIYQNYPELLSITAEDNTKIYNSDGDYHEAKNTNQILTQIPQLQGSKTGYTSLAGGNLTIVFDAGLNRPIIITVLGSSFSGRFTDMLNLIEATQANLINSTK